MDKLTEEELKIIEKYQGWRIQDVWGRHNFSSRFIIVTMISLMVALVYGMFTGVNVPASVLESGFWSLTAIAIIYAIGANALDKSADLIGKIKGFR